LPQAKKELEPLVDRETRVLVDETRFLAEAVLARRAFDPFLDRRSIRR
jgi:hypothetical protein